MDDAKKRNGEKVKVCHTVEDTAFLNSNSSPAPNTHLIPSSPILLTTKRSKDIFTANKKFSLAVSRDLTVLTQQ